jgi:hypothetical protein
VVGHKNGVKEDLEMHKQLEADVQGISGSLALPHGATIWKKNSRRRWRSHILEETQAGPAEAGGWSFLVAGFLRFVSVLLWSAHCCVF